MSRKQALISLSTAEAEYIAAGSCCTQLLWMKKLLCDYGFTQDTMIINCDNTSAINIYENPVQHSRTKHIDIRHHFLRDLVESEVASLSFIPTDNKLADILTKPLDGSRFESLRKAIGVCDMSKTCFSFLGLDFFVFLKSYPLIAWFKKINNKKKKKNWGVLEQGGSF
jgi:hypothetical protein